MPRPQGLPKTGGRQKGTLNKRTYALRELLVQEGLRFEVELVDAIRKENWQKLQALTGVLPYLHPKLAQQEITVHPGEASDVTPEDGDAANARLEGKVRE